MLEFNFHFPPIWVYEIREFFRRKINEGMACPRRGESAIHEQGRNLDYWYKVKKDRVCSFCGSAHPDEFMDFVRRVIATNGVFGTIEISDKKYKIYLNRGYRNCDDGALKFYTMHLLKKDWELARPLINEANKISWDVFMKRMHPKLYPLMQGSVK